ncbi:ArnT family glycosyltransferase [Actinomycetospora cinnamomea]|uniref:4-amino-4-deoxy-L-arabinose transferase-like glycosyltransferase n=1 Tax=Actinomycetospora cinnamomea TaxID=663609 RepID=A0A2U1FCE3_9PSEU|nr:hypothetical protein [Actinomycetospora cinnamomea]PVZ09640.1 hypothetical protein C8D89_106305 [Actinomycetospora cinnamomea]
MATGLEHSVDGPPRDVPTVPDEAEPSARRRRWWRSSTALVAAGGGLLGALLFLVAYRGMPDDSYITLDYARNVVEHGHWGLTPFRDANSATSPLNVWLLAAGILVTGRPVVAVGLVLIATTALTAVWAAQLGRLVGVRPPLVAGLTVGLLVTSPVFAAVVGMESFLVAATLVGVARYAAERRAVAAGVVTGLAVLTRPDLVLPAVVLVVVLFLVRGPRAWRGTLLALGVGALVTLPWHVWSWFVLGSFVPDSLIIKTSGAFPGGEVFGNGPLFMAERWPIPMLAVGVVAGVGVVSVVASAVRWVRGRDRLLDRVVVAAGLAGGAHYAAYAAMGVSSYIWYYCPSLALLTLCAAVGAADLRARVTGTVVTGLVLVAGIGVGNQVALGVPWPHPAIFGNWASATDYLHAGTQLGRTLPPGQSVLAPGEIGTLAFGCECDIVDQFSDRARLMSIVDSRLATAGPLEGALLRLNFLHAERLPVEAPDRQLVYETGPGPGWPTYVIGRGAGHLVLE